MATRTEISVERKATRFKIEARWGGRERFFASLEDPRFAPLGLPNPGDWINTTIDTDEFRREVAALNEATPARWTERVVNPWSDAAQIDAMMKEAD